MTTIFAQKKQITMTLLSYDLLSSLELGHSRSQQRTDQRVLVITLKFLALKKTAFSPVKNTFQNFFDFFLPLFYATF